jgi:uncharacterized membrane protein (UPF0127 family)
MKQFNVQIPRSLQEGLGGQTKIESPMLFEFPEVKIHSMWMKGMLVPIDIVWINKDGIITRVYKNVPITVGPKYSSVTPAKYAIECAAGDADKLGLLPGHEIRILRK